MIKGSDIHVRIENVVPMLFSGIGIEKKVPIFCTLTLISFNQD